MKPPTKMQALAMNVSVACQVSWARCNRTPLSAPSTPTIQEFHDATAGDAIINGENTIHTPSTMMTNGLVMSAPPSCTRRTASGRERRVARVQFDHTPMAIGAWPLTTRVDSWLQSPCVQDAPRPREGLSPPEVHVGHNLRSSFSPSSGRGRYPKGDRMSAASNRHLPERPSLEQLRKQAKEHLETLRAADSSATLAAAQHALAREYGFDSWPKLVHHVESMQPANRLLQPADLRSDQKLLWSPGRGTD